MVGLVTRGFAAGLLAGLLLQPEIMADALRKKPVDLVCRDPSCFVGDTGLYVAAAGRRRLGQKAFSLPPLGAVTPRGWLLEQLLVQANALSGYMASSTFPGAITVNQSMWVGGTYKTGTDQVSEEMYESVSV